MEEKLEAHERETGAYCFRRGRGSRCSMRPDHEERWRLFVGVPLPAELRHWCGLSAASAPCPDCA